MSDVNDGNKRDFRFPRMSRGMKKLIIGYLVIFVMLVGTLTALELVQRVGIGDVRRQASTSNVDLSLNAPGTATVGTPFTVNVIVTRTNNRQVTAADVVLNYDATLFRLDSLQHGTFFNPTGMAKPPTTADPYAQTLNFVDVNGKRIAVGAFCDVCYLGSAPNPNPDNIPSCGTATPQCYPKTTANGTLAVATFTPLKSGTGTISFNNTSTQVAALGSDTDVKGDLTASGTITVAAGTPTCAIDLDNNGTVSLADYGVFKTKYIAFLNTGTFDSTIDLDSNGSIGLADYGVFKTKYIAYLSTGTCN